MAGGVATCPRFPQRQVRLNSAPGLRDLSCAFLSDNHTRSNLQIRRLQNASFRTSGPDLCQARRRAGGLCVFLSDDLRHEAPNGVINPPRPSPFPSSLSPLALSFVDDMQAIKNLLSPLASGNSNPIQDTLVRAPHLPHVTASTLSCRLARTETGGHRWNRRDRAQSVRVGVERFH